MSEHPRHLGPGAVVSSHVERVGDVVVISLSGEFDLASGEAFARLMAEIESLAPEAVVIDLGELSFLDSAAGRTLFEAQRRAGSQGFAILRGSGPASRTLALTGLAEHMTVVDRVEDLARG